MTPQGATQTSPYELVYGHHTVLPWEMQSDSRRVVLQKDLSSKNYNDLMMNELEDLHIIRLRALENIEKNKIRVAKYYNKKVKVNEFAEGDLVWKALLPIGTKYSTFGKWSPNWEGPFRVVRCTPGNAYILKTLLGEEFTAAINGRYLKKYYPVLKLIVDYKHQDYKHQKYRNNRRSGRKPPLEQKILTKEMVNTKVYCP
jgi:hypothetical protein